MNTQQVIASRRAVRDYTDESIPRETVHKLIETAILAPSARNNQPWSFAVLLDRDRIEALADRAKFWLLETQVQQLGEMAKRLQNPELSLFYHAPALVMIMATESSTQANEDCCLAAQTFMLAARDAGLGTCWIGLARPWLNLPHTKAELGLPAQYHVVAPLVLGYPDHWPEPTERKRAEISWLDR